MGRGGDPEGRPFDWLADIKLNNGLTLARRPHYYQHTLTYTQTHTLLQRISTRQHTLTLTMNQDSLYFSQVASGCLTDLNIRSIYHLMFLSCPGTDGFGSYSL